MLQDQRLYLWLLDNSHMRRDGLNDDAPQIGVLGNSGREDMIDCNGEMGSVPEVTASTPEAFTGQLFEASYVVLIGDCVHF